MFVVGCQEQLLHNLSESDLTRIVSRLEAQGVKAVRERQPDGRWTISVHSDDVSKALKLIDTQRLLRTDRTSGDQKSSMLSSREEQRFQFERALSRELESTLGALDGVFEARVHLNLPPIDPIFGQQLSPTKGTASVLLLVGPEFSAHLTEISSMVAGASGIPIGGVSVLVSQSKELTEVTTEQSELGLKSIPNPEVNHHPGMVSRITFQRAGEIVISLLILGMGTWALIRSRRKRGIIDGATNLQTLNDRGLCDAS